MGDKDSVTHATCSLAHSLLVGGMKSAKSDVNAKSSSPMCGAVVLPNFVCSIPMPTGFLAALLSEFVTKYAPTEAIRS